MMNPMDNRFTHVSVQPTTHMMQSNNGIKITRENPLITGSQKLQPTRMGMKQQRECTVESLLYGFVRHFFYQTCRKNITVNNKFDVISQPPLTCRAHEG